MTWAAIGIIAAVTALDVAAFWWLTKTPAGVEPNPPERLPLPGPTPAQAASDASPPPGPGPTHWVHDVRYREAACRCFEVINHIHGTRRISRCTRHAFEAEWERRYAQS